MVGYRAGMGKAPAVPLPLVPPPLAPPPPPAPPLPAGCTGFPEQAAKTLAGDTRTRDASGAFGKW